MKLSELITQLQQFQQQHGDQQIELIENEDRTGYHIHNVYVTYNGEYSVTEGIWINQDANYNWAIEE